MDIEKLKQFIVPIFLIGALIGGIAYFAPKIWEQWTGYQSVKAEIITKENTIKEKEAKIEEYKKREAEEKAREQQKKRQRQTVLQTCNGRT